MQFGDRTKTCIMRKHLLQAIAVLTVILYCGFTASATTPTNDLCADAISVSLGDTPYSTVGASSSFPEGLFSHNTYIGYDIWYSFEAPSSGTVTMTTCGQASYDTWLQVWSGCPSSGDAYVAANDDDNGCGLRSTVEFEVTAGSTYILQVGGYPLGPNSRGPGAFTLSLESDLCGEDLAFDPPLADATVQCLDELPTECDATQGATRGDVSCVLGSAVSGRTECVATTAMGSGADGAIVLMDIDGDPDDDRFFMPTDEGMSLVQYDNGVAVVTGQVADVEDEDAILNVNIVYENGVCCADLTGGFKVDQIALPPPTSPMNG